MWESDETTSCREAFLAARNADAVTDDDLRALVVAFYRFMKSDRPEVVAMHAVPMMTILPDRLLPRFTAMVLEENRENPFWKANNEGAGQR